MADAEKELIGDADESSTLHSVGKGVDHQVANFKIGGMTCGACVEVSGGEIEGLALDCAD